MNWNRLQQIGQLDAIVAASAHRPQLIFKHSTRCSISAAARYRLEAAIDALSSMYDLHFLDLLVHRDISAGIADRFGIVHQSPQVIVVEQGRSTYSASHYDIQVSDLLSLPTNA